MTEELDGIAETNSITIHLAAGKICREQADRMHMRRGGR